MSPSTPGPRPRTRTRSPARSPRAHAPAPAGDAAASLFAALGDPTRLALVRRLCTDGPLPIARLTEGTGVSRQAVTKHLRVLRAAGLARARRHARSTLWAIEPRRLDDARRWLDHIGAQWDEVLARLKAAVE